MIIKQTDEQTNKENHTKFDGRHLAWYFGSPKNTLRLEPTWSDWGVSCQRAFQTHSNSRWILAEWVGVNFQQLAVETNIREYIYIYSWVNSTLLLGIKACKNSGRWGLQLFERCQQQFDYSQAVAIPPPSRCLILRRFFSSQCWLLCHGFLKVTVHPLAFTCVLAHSLLL